MLRQHDIDPSKASIQRQIFFFLGLTFLHGKLREGKQKNEEIN